MTITSAVAMRSQAVSPALSVVAAGICETSPWAFRSNLARTVRHQTREISPSGFPFGTSALVVVLRAQGRPRAGSVRRAGGGQVRDEREVPLDCRFPVVRGVGDGDTAFPHRGQRLGALFEDLAKTAREIAGV